MTIKKLIIFYTVFLFSPFFKILLYERKIFIEKTFFEEKILYSSFNL